MEKRRETIIQNAFQMFCERGIEAVRLVDITKRSKVSENTVYRYFESKENLVLEAFIKAWDTSMNGLEKKVKENAPDYCELSGREQIREWIQAFKHLYLAEREFVLFSYEAKLYLIRHKIRVDKTQQDALMYTIKEPCLTALEKGKKDGSIISDKPNEDLFYAMWGSIRGYIVKIVVYGELYGEDSPWESRYSIMQDGILSALRSGWFGNQKKGVWQDEIEEREKGLLKQSIVT